MRSCREMRASFSAPGVGALAASGLGVGALGLGVAVGVGLGLGLGLGVAVGDGVGEGVHVGDGVQVGEGVYVGDGVACISSVPSLLASAPGGYTQTPDIAGLKRAGAAVSGGRCLHDLACLSAQ